MVFPAEGSGDCSLIINLLVITWFAQSQVLWEHLVDTKRKYSFPVEMEVLAYSLFLFVSSFLRPI